MAIFDVGIIITALNRAAAPLRDVNRQLVTMERNAQRAHRGMRAIDVVLAGIATGTATALVKKLVEVAAETENLRLRFGVLFRDVDRGVSVFKQLQQAFERSPIDINATADAFVRLKSAGIDAAFESTKALTDAVVAFGGSTNEFKRASLALGQIAGKGTLQMEELRQQLGEAVPTAARILADELGISTAKLFQQISRGQIDATTALENLRRGFEKNFGGITDTLGRGLTGTMQRIRNVVTQTIDRIFNDTSLGTKLAIVFDRIADAIKRWGESITEADIDRFFVMLTNFARVAEGVLRALYDIGRALLAVANAVAAVIGVTGAEVLTYGIVGLLFFGKAGFIIGTAIGVAVKVADAFNGAVVKMGGAVKTLLDRFGAAAEFGLIGGLLLGPQGFIIATVVAYVLDGLLSAIRDFVLTAAKIVGASDFAKDVEDLFGKSGSSLLKKSLDDIHGAIGGLWSESANRGSLTDSLIGTPEEIAERKKSIADTIKAVREQQTKIELSVAGENAATQLGRLEDRIQQTLAGSISLPFESTVENFRNDLKEIDNLIAAERRRLADAISNFGETDPIFAKLAAGVADLEAMREAAQGLVAAFRASELKKFADELQRDLGRVQDQLTTINHDLIGDEAGEAIARINQQFNERGRELQKQVDQAARLVALDGSRQKILDSANAAVADNNRLREKSIEIQKRLNDLIVERKGLESKAAVLQSDAELRDLSRRFREGFAAAFSSDFVDEAERLQDEFGAKIIQLNLDINKLLQAREKASETDKRLIDEQIGAIERLREKYGELRGRVDAFALVTEETMRKVGQAITDSLVDAIDGFVSGTKSAKDVLNDFYRTANKLAIEYLLNLAKIELQQKAIGTAGSSAGSGGGGAGFFGMLAGLFSGGAGSGAAAGSATGIDMSAGFLGAVARGGAFRGRVKPFASGGIVNGPMMFGLMGEAGEEAIMPLGRDRRGRLGVRGGGGDQFHINITAVDGPGVRDLFMREGSALVESLTHRMRLNRGMRTT
jgi:tape measure domain-containing protein